MPQTLKLQSLGFLAVYWLTTNTLAQADEDLFQLPLDQLVNAKVVIASKQEQSLDKAPSVVTVITAQHIQQYGANNLHDVLRRVPGLYPGNSNPLRDNYISIRGQHSSSIDRRTLLLVNGRPFRDANTGGLNSPFYRSFPISAIQQIEIIRGPGSVLYGSNAVSGVINIVTRQDQGSKIKTYMGSFGTWSGEGSTVHESGDLLIQASAKWTDSNGWDYKATDNTGISDSTDFAYEDTGINLDLQYGNARLQWFEGNADDVVMSGRYNWPTSFYNRQRRFVDAGYAFDLNSNWQLQSNITYNSQERDIEDNSVVAEDEYWLGEIALNGAVGAKGKFVGGITYHDLDSDDDSNPTETINYNTHWKTAYIQYTQSFASALDVTLGAQHNSTDNTDDTSYRAGIVYQLQPGMGFKLLWAEAFRSPFATETSFNSAVLKGNPDQLPERSESWDAQFFYHSNRYFFELTYYQTDLKDASMISPAPDGGLVFSNQGELEFSGYELELRNQVNAQLSLEGSISYQENENQSGVEDTQIIPNTMVKLGLSYQHPNGLELAIFDNWYDEPAEWTDYSNNIQAVNPDADSYHHVTVNLRADLERLMNNNGWRGVSVSLWVDNALESDAVYQPETRNVGVNTIPMRAERSYYLKGEYRW